MKRESERHVSFLIESWSRQKYGRRKWVNEKRHVCASIYKKSVQIHEKIRTLSQTLNKHSDSEISRCHVEGNVDVTLQSDEKLFVVYPSELGWITRRLIKRKKKKNIHHTQNSEKTVCWCYVCFRSRIRNSWNVLSTLDQSSRKWGGGEVCSSQHRLWANHVRTQRCRNLRERHANCYLSRRIWKEMTLTKGHSGTNICIAFTWTHWHCCKFLT